MRRKDYYSNSKDYINRWVISYADFTTLLLALFVVMYGLSKMHINYEKPLLQPQAAKNKISEKVNLPANLAKVKIYTKNVNNLNKKVPEEKINKNFNAISSLQTGNKMASKDIEKLLNAKLKNTKGVLLKKDSKGVIIRLNNAVLFDPGSAIIKKNALPTLDKLSGVIAKVHNSVRIEGHTDNTPIKTGKFPSNWELSTARATNIVVYLIKTHKISPDRLSAVGYGEYKPINQNKTVKEKAANRRVDVVILNPDKQE